MILAMVFVIRLCKLPAIIVCVSGMTKLGLFYSVQLENLDYPVSRSAFAKEHKSLTSSTSFKIG